MDKRQREEGENGGEGGGDGEMGVAKGKMVGGDGLEDER